MKNLLLFALLLFLFSVINSSCRRESTKFKTYKLDSDISTTYEQKIQKLRNDNAGNGTNPIPCNVLVNLDDFRVADEGLAIFGVESSEKMIGSIINFHNHFGFGLPRNMNLTQTPFLVKSNDTVEPMKTIKSSKETEGIFITFGVPSTNKIGSGEAQVEIYLKLVKLELLSISPDSVLEVTKYALLNNEKVLFKCKDLENGIWERVSKDEVDVAERNLINKTKYSGFKGYYVGINSFVKKLDRYFYLGYAESNFKPNIQVIIANNKFTTTVTYDAKLNPIIKYNNLPNCNACASTISNKIMVARHKKADYPLGTNCSNSLPMTNSSCIRPCPTFCAD